MTDAWGRLHVEVLEDEIIITLEARQQQGACAWVDRVEKPSA